MSLTCVTQYNILFSTTPYLRGGLLDPLVYNHPRVSRIGYQLFPVFTLLLSHGLAPFLNML